MPTNLATRTPYGIIVGSGEDLYRESVTKSLIDYILYSCTRKTKLKVDVGMGKGNRPFDDAPEKK